MPEEKSAIPISVRVPADVIATLDKVATILERSRSWVILRAIRQYLADEGQEVLDVQEGIKEAERGEMVEFDEPMARFEEILAKVETKDDAAG